MKLEMNKNKHMKRVLFSMIIGILGILPGSCSLEQEIDDAKKGKMQLALSVDKIYTETVTRATVASEEGEDRISTLYLLFFEPDPYLNGHFVDYVKVDVPITGWAMQIRAEINVDIDISATSLVATDPYHILAIANIADDRYIKDVSSVDLWMDQWMSKTESQVMFEARAWVKEKIPVTPDALLMSGRAEKASGVTRITLLVGRAQVRLDVNNSLMNTTHDLVSSSVWNSYPVASIFGEGAIDYSIMTPRIREHYGISNVTNETGTFGSDGKGPILGNILGGLYCFENNVTTPQTYDKFSTCLIIGLKERSSGNTTYYRANILQEGSAQSLRRNHVYRVTIQGVNGPGAETEELAYIGRGNTLEYTIGIWNLDDNGLIVQDDYSILMIPTKTINIGREASTSNFSIYTFTSLTDAAPLTIRSQTYSPIGNNIRASLDGNTLVIDADALGLSETERRGVIVLSFAGLETSMTVIQSGKSDDYLRVYLPDGGIPRFLSYGGIPSGLIRVEASGPWTARIYLDGFSFNPTIYPAPRVTILKSTDGAVIDSKFRVYTHSHNQDIRVREAFIVVTLDKDPENYSAVIRISQSAAGAIKLMPDDQTTVIFTGTGALAPIPGNNVNEFQVLPGFTTGTPPEVIGWTASLLPSGPFNDTGEFTLTYLWDKDVPTNNKVKVEAKGLNTSGRTYTVILRIQTDPATYTDITVTQQPANWEVPPTPPSIPAVGGTTATLLLNAPSILNYKVDILTLSPSTLVNHFAYLIDPDTPGNTYSSLKARSVSKGFIVGFPKLIYPNVGAPVQATISVTIVETGESKVFTVTQSQVTQHPMNILNVGTSWGQISNAANSVNAAWGWSYNQYYQQYLSNTTHFGPSGQVKTNGNLSLASNSGTATNFNATYPNRPWRYIHYSRPGNINNSAADNTIHSWLTGGDNGVLYVSNEDSGADATRSFSSSFFPGRMGIAGGGSLNDTYSIINLPGNRIIQYLTVGDATDKWKGGPWAGTDRSDWHTITFTTAGTTTWMDPSSVTSLQGAVPVLRNAATTRTVLVLDPKRNFLVSGDSEIFYTSGTYQAPPVQPNSTNTRSRFLCNLLAYVVNSGQYGSHFTDYFWDSPRMLMTPPTPQP